MKLERYFSRFHLISALSCEPGIIYFPVANGQAIRLGYVVGFSAGYAQEITSIQDAVIAGIAATANTAAEASSAGAVSVGVIPIKQGHRFSVPVEANALVTQAAVGTLIDLQSANTVDISDTVTLGYGFRVEAIDVSSKAIAANAYGFVIGHFEYKAAS